MSIVSIVAVPVAPASASSDLASLAQRTQTAYEPTQCAFDARSHAQLIARTAAEAIHDKYIRGQQEHGGNLPEKAGMLAHAEAEARDLIVYQHVLRDQLTELRAQAVALLAGIDKVLGAAQD